MTDTNARKVKVGDSLTLKRDYHGSKTGKVVWIGFNSASRPLFGLQFADKPGATVDFSSREVQ